MNNSTSNMLKGKIPRTKKRFGSFTPLGTDEDARPTSAHNHKVVTFDELLETGEYEKVELAHHLPSEIRYELDEHDITDEAHIFIKSDFVDKHELGESYLIALEDSLVMMWRHHGEPFTILSFANEAIEDIGGEVDSTDKQCYIFVADQGQSHKMWFHESYTGRVLSFLELWKQRCEDLSEMSATESALLRYERRILFGAILLKQISDDKCNVSASGFGIVKNLMKNARQLEQSIDLFKNVSLHNLCGGVNNFFNDEQKLLLMTNLIDLSLRHGEEHEVELNCVKKMGEEICFPPQTIEEIIYYSRAKNFTSILEAS
ncbi:MAG: hypothetical protein HRT88_10950 [Lentisphaeraceae bacterium]|nr:hypothetical protein [Lentisphaeraceae bacterium]